LSEEYIHLHTFCHPQIRQFYDQKQSTGAQDAEIMEGVQKILAQAGHDLQNKTQSEKCLMKM